jgi:hypothetical protein
VALGVVISGGRSEGEFSITGDSLGLGGFVWVLVLRDSPGIVGGVARDCDATSGSLGTCTGSSRRLWGSRSGGVLFELVPSLDDV